MLKSLLCASLALAVGLVAAADAEAPAAPPPAPPAEAPAPATPAAAPAAAPTTTAAPTSAEIAAQEALKSKQDQYESLCNAAAQGDDTMIASLLAAATPDWTLKSTQINYEGYSPLHFAVIHQRKNYLAVISKLLAAGCPADIGADQQGPHHSNALFHAVKNGDEAAFDLLVSGTKYWGSVDNRGRDSLFRACFMAESQTMCQKIKAAGSPTAIAEREGREGAWDQKWQRDVLGIPSTPITHSEL
jgi:hypothetical protein